MASPAAAPRVRTADVLGGAGAEAANAEAGGPAPAAAAPETFGELHLPGPLTEALARCGFDRPSPVQAAALPPCRAGGDVVVQAKAGACPPSPAPQPPTDRPSPGGPAVPPAAAASFPRG